MEEASAASSNNFGLCVAAFCMCFCSRRRGVKVLDPQQVSKCRCGEVQQVHVQVQCSAVECQSGRKKRGQYACRQCWRSPKTPGHQRPRGLIAIHAPDAVSNINPISLSIIGLSICPPVIPICPQHRPTACAQSPTRAYNPVTNGRSSPFNLEPGPQVPPSLSIVNQTVGTLHWNC